MQYAKLTEYFEYRDIQYPALWSIVTSVAYQVSNEVIERGGGGKTVNVDMIADIYLFNTAGFFLFSTEWGKRFFSETLPVYDRMPQPIIEPYSRRIQNAGQQYFVRKNFDALGKWSPIFYWGVFNTVGVSYNYVDNHSLTFTVGRVVNKLTEGRLRGFRKLDPTLDGTIGIFWDNNNSLMSSLLLTGPGLYNLQLNIYPASSILEISLLESILQQENGTVLFLELPSPIFRLDSVTARRKIKKPQIHFCTCGF